MDWLEELIRQLSELSDVQYVVSADKTGAYLQGNGCTNPEETAAILTFIGQAGQNIGNSLGLDELQSVAVVGNKDRLLIYQAGEYMIGLALTEKGLLTKVETQANRLIEDAISTLEA